MRNLLLTFLCFTLTFLSNAQPGRLDATFNPTDGGDAWGDGTENTVASAIVQADGKILIAGNFRSYNRQTNSGIARVRTDGTTDWLSSGYGTDKGVLCMAVQPDGKILIGGAFTTYNNTARNYIARLNSNGSLDATFDPGSGANNQVAAIAVQSDGKVLIGGTFTSYNGTARNYIARLNADGSLDAAFNAGSGPDNAVSSITVQGDGKILISGSFTSYNGTTAEYITRLNSDGTLDASFTIGSGTNGLVQSMTVLSDGKILISGAFTLFNGTARSRIARLNADGSLDASFDPGSGANNWIASTTLQPDGKIVIGGAFTSFNGAARNRIARLNSDGSLDTSFDPGSGADNFVTTTALQSDGKIVVGGSFTLYNGLTQNRITRLNPDGSLDASFNSGSGANSVVYSLAVQPDDKILIGGQFTSYNGVQRNRIARLNTDGTLDASFNPGSGANDIVYSLALQPDGKILIGGQFTSFNGTARNYIARLNADGTLDASFNPGSGANGTVLTVVLQPDGKILVGGQFTSFNGTAHNRIARLNSDGTLDASFNPGSGANDIITSVAVQGDGKILIGGYFTAYGGTTQNHIARLNADGILDASFNSGSGLNKRVESIVLAPGGKILIGGLFTSYNGTASNCIARLNPDGTLDASFNTGSGANNMVMAIALQSDDKIIMGGSFSQYNGTARNWLARLNPDGSLDTEFVPSGSLNSSINRIALQSDGKIMIGGWFYSPRNRVARVIGPYNAITTGTISPTSYCAGDAVSVPFTVIGTYTEGNVFTAQLSSPWGLFTSPVTIGTLTATTSGTIAATLPSNLSAGSSYRIRVVSTTPAITAPDNGANIAIGAIPAATTIAKAGPTTFCQGGSIELVSSSAYSNQWYKDGVAISGATDFKYTATETGNYTVTISQGSCSSAPSAPVSVTVNPAPARPTITQSGNILSSSSATGNQWYKNGVAISGATGQQYTAQTSGQYTVQVTQGGCSSAQSEAVNFVVTALGNPELWNGEVITYPNPVQDHLQITNSSSRRLNVQLVDVMGKTVRELQFSASSTSLSLKELAAGTYLLLITDLRKGETISKTIVKQ